MAKRNKKKLKQRKAKQLKRQLKQVNTKVDEQMDTLDLTSFLPPIEEPHTPKTDEQYEEQKRLFNTKLDADYGGTVTPLTAYVNEHAVMVYKCSKCGLTFFGKPSHILGMKHQRHECGLPYGDKDGTRLERVGSKNKAKKGKDQQATLNKINTMIWNDYSYKQIASELKVNPIIIKDYFISEGLIEK